MAEVLRLKIKAACFCEMFVCTLHGITTQNDSKPSPQQEPNILHHTTLATQNDYYLFINILEMYKLHTL